MGKGQLSWRCSCGAAGESEGLQLTIDRVLMELYGDHRGRGHSVDIRFQAPTDGDRARYEPGGYLPKRAAA